MILFNGTSHPLTAVNPRVTKTFRPWKIVGFLAFWDSRIAEIDEAGRVTLIPNKVKVNR